ncbi:MAG: LamG-like jellyroll fold domain-containing protein [Bacillota bacterium]|nr:LamG-like jellyroll fold domain-containing protein [Bacillota bacterium]
MKKSFYRLLMVILTLQLAFFYYNPVVIYAADDYGNTFSTAYTIACNTKISGSLEVAGDIDYFKFTTGSSGTYTVETYGSTDTYGYLYDSDANNTLIAENDEGASEGNNFSISSSLLANHTYFVAVQHFDLVSGTGSYTLSVNYGVIKVQMQPMNVSSVTQGISTAYKIYNVSSSSISLSTIKLRYYYTVDTDVAQSFTCDFATTSGSNNTTVDSSKVTGSFTKMSSPVASADYYLEIGFQSGTLASGEYCQVQIRFNHSDWSNYIQQGDYSFKQAQVFETWFNVTGYVSGSLQWGSTPSNFTPTATATSTSTPTMVPWTSTPTFTYNSTSTPTKAPSTSTPTPTKASTTSAFTPTNTPTPAPTGLWNIARWYKFDETSGTVAADSSGNLQNGTVNNGATWVTNAKMYGGLDLNGSDQYVSLPAGITSSLNDFTISAWVNLDTLNTWVRIFDFGVGTNSYMHLTAKSGSGVLKFGITTNGYANEEQINGTSALPTGSWQHVAVTLSGNKGSLYLNGQLVGTNNNMTLKPSSLGDTTLNYIGKSMFNDPNLDGKVDDFRIYNKALSTSEISSIYYLSSAKLASWYKFDETSGTTAVDSSVALQNGTVNNGATWATAGKINGALNLSGSSQYVSLPTGTVSSLNDFTISAWVNLDTLSTWTRIFEFASSTTSYMFLTAKGGTNVLRFTISTSGSANDQQINGTSALATGSWQYVAVTLSGNTGSLYLNGALVGTNTNMTLNPSDLGITTQNYIGKSRSSSDPYLDGKIDDFKIYNKALSSDEIASIYSSRTQTSAMDLIEAEDSDITGGAAARSYYDALRGYGYSGNGYVYMIQNAGAASEFTVNVPAAGDYDFVVRYSNATGDTSTLTAVLNGSDVTKVQFSNLKSWDFWDDCIVTLHLNSGINTIAFLHDNDDVGNVFLDYIRYIGSLTQADAINVAKSKTVTFGCTGSLNTSFATDGYADVAGNYTRLGATGLQWMQIDLGASYNIGKINLWHYFGDPVDNPRLFHDVIVQLSNAADFSSGVTTVFNNDTDNSAKKGIGNDEEYVETSSGKEIKFDTQKARYVRLWSNGNSKSGSNLYTEVQVWSQSGDYWNFDEGSGNKVYDSCGINDGVLGSLTNSPTWIASGLSGKALKFDGNNDYISLGKRDLSYPWTASFWVKRTNTVNSNAVLMSSSGYALMLEQNNVDRKVGFVDYITQKTYSFNYSVPQNLSNWTNLTFVGTKAGTSLYVDGKFRSASPNAIYCPMDKIGSSSNALNGSLDDIRIFNRELMPSEIYDMVSKGLPPSSAPNPYAATDVVKGNISSDKDLTKELIRQYSTLNYNIAGDKINLSSVKPKDVILVIDNSGSMSKDLRGQTTGNFPSTKVYAVNQAVNSFIEQCRGQDMNIGIVPFNNTSYTPMNMVSMLNLNPDGTAVNEAALKQFVKNMGVTGSTNIGDALRRAYYMLKDSTNDKYIVLLTDGLSNTFSYTGSNPDEFEMGGSVYDSSKIKMSTDEDPDGKAFLYASSFGQIAANSGIKQFLVGFALDNAATQRLEALGVSLQSDTVGGTNHYYSAKTLTGLQDVYSTIHKEIDQYISLKNATLTQTLPEGTSVVNVSSPFTVSQKDGIYSISGVIGGLKLKLVNKNPVEYQLDTSSIPAISATIKYNTAGIKNFSGFKISYTDPSGASREFLSNSWNVNVENIGIYLEKNKTNMSAKKTIRIKVVKITPDYAPQTVIWKSSDDSIATVTPVLSSDYSCWEAEVTSLKNENAKITISAYSTYDSEFFSSCSVRILSNDLN